MDTMKVFTSYDIQACLYDEERVELFRRAIEAAVRPGAVVVDAGSGTGLLGLLAAKAGAAKVYCLEISEEYVTVIRRNAERNGLDHIVEAIHADATTCDLPGKVDVIVSEVISAGFFYEPQLQILNNLRRFLKPGGQVVPLGMENTVELISAQDTLYDLRFDYDTRYRALPDDLALTTAETYLATNFRTRTNPHIKASAVLTGTVDGLANAVRIGYRIEFTDGVWAEKATEFLMNPQIIFLPEPVRVVPGQAYKVALAYDASSSPLTATLAVATAREPLAVR